MEHLIEVDANATRFTVTTDGQGDVEGITAFLNDIIGHQMWRPGMNILLDHRRLTIAAITVEDIDRVSAYFRKIAPRLGDGRIALVMNKDIDFGIARAWELVTQEHVDMEIGVFRTVEEARTWIDQSKQSEVTP